MHEEKQPVLWGIDPTRLDQTQYTAALIAQALEKGLLHETEVQRFQMGCMGVLARLSRQWNGGRSSSIRIEDAQMLTQSMLWLIGLVLKAQPTPAQALQLLIHTPVDALYDEGLQLAQRKTRAAKIRWMQVTGRLFQTRCSFYADAFAGIRGFFKLYRPAFAAQEIHITADYPTFVPVEDLAGIEFIETYLDRLSLENGFLCRFDRSAVDALFGRRPEYGQDQLFNLFGAVWTAAVGCACTGRDVQQLTLSNQDLLLLENSLCSMARGQIAALLARVRRQLVQTLSLSPALDAYIRQGEWRLAGEIHVACREHWLDRLFPTEDAAVSRPILCAFGEKMPDPAFRSLLKQLASCDTWEQRLEKIRTDVHSLADLEDLLLAGCLTADDVEAVLCLLMPQELAALWQRHVLVPSAQSGQLTDRLKAFMQTRPAQVQHEMEALSGRIMIVES